jgi:hypothetical protein
MGLEEEFIAVYCLMLPEVYLPKTTAASGRVPGFVVASFCRETRHRDRLAEPRRGGKIVAGGKREARGPRSGRVPQEPRQGRKAFIRMPYLSPLQGSCWLHPLTPGCAALARGYSLAAPSGQNRTRFATETS